MTKKILMLLALLILVFHLKGQEKQNKIDIRIGSGISLLGTGDMTTLNIENEVNYKYSRLLSNSVSLQYGRSNSGVWKTASFIQGNLNIFISPFKNDRKNDFRIGTGLGCYTISDAYQESAEYSNGQLVDEDYKFEIRNSFGINFILENTYSITDRFLIGLKLFTQPYFNGDINTGGLLKFGVRF
jgi:hypothetical protein